MRGRTEPTFWWLERYRKAVTLSARFVLVNFYRRVVGKSSRERVGFGSVEGFGDVAGSE